LTNSQFWNCKYGFDGATKCTNFYCTNCIFAGTASTGTGISSLNTYSFNNQFYELNYDYDYCTMEAADFNNYDGQNRFGSDMTPSPGYFTTFSAWQAAWPGIDTHTTQTNQNYAAGLYVPTVSDPSGP